MVTKTPDLNNLLERQADMMSAASAAGQAVATQIGNFVGHLANCLELQTQVIRRAALVLIKHQFIKTDIERLCQACQGF
ncbi:hypothetical protein R54767_02429 [Paraburkholderia gardini]|uniref:Uncharacterized protein n=1 Tax=Paraburkholderia gardini TaxID=2823469 RepID=A0ABN7QJH4_9BURK|nr:hypothetical protein R54767_02429 [Paraburkholderia gardini]